MVQENLDTRAKERSEASNWYLSLGSLGSQPSCPLTAIAEFSITIGPCILFYFGLSRRGFFV